jgi:hypothetical protein
MVAGKLAKLKRTDNLKKGDAMPEVQICPSVTEASKMLNVSPRSTKNAKTVISNGSDTLNQAVEQGVVSVSLHSAMIFAKSASFTVAMSCQRED